MTKKKKNDPYDLCAIYDVSEPIPEEFLDPDDLEPTLENTSVYVIEPDGALYFYCGNTKIKVTEHFAKEGKTMGGFIQLRIQLTKTHAYDTSIYDFGSITHENAEILF